jgi:CRP/FNR family transcriptional regulator
MAIQTRHIPEAPSTLGGQTSWLDFNSAFKNCSLQIKDAIARHSQKRTYHKGDYLVKPGDREAGAYFIEKGLVKVSKIGYHRKEFILWMAEAGDSVGLNCVIDDDPFYFSAMAVDEVTAHFIPAADLKLILKKEPVLTMQLIRDLCRNLFLIENRITSISRKKIRAQCAEMLINIAEKKDTADSKNMLVGYSINHLASLIGTTKNYLYKIIAELTGKGILTVRKRRLVISDMDALSKIAMEKD